MNPKEIESTLLFEIKIRDERWEELKKRIDIILNDIPGIPGNFGRGGRRDKKRDAAIDAIMQVQRTMRELEEK